jgi:superfamily II DNA helicase RecQ
MRLKIKASIDTLTRNGFSGLCRKFIASRKQHPTPRAPRPVSGEAIHPELQKWRQQLASERKVPPFYILTNATLVNLTTTRPATIDALRSVKGIGPQKIKDYGQQLLAFFNQS